MEQAFEIVKQLVKDFQAQEAAYLSPTYREAQVRQDFIDKFFTALGWDVTHTVQKNPYQQEVKIENRISTSGSQRRADYAFFIAPNYQDVKYFVEAKKPARDLTNPENYHQAIRYGWNAGTPLVILTDFEEFHILDCRYKPDIDTALDRKIRVLRYTEYSDKDNFAEIFFLLGREAVAGGSIDKYAATLPKPRGKAIQRGLFKGGYQPVDEAFLEELDGYRESLAKAFKKANENLQGEELTEAVQRTLDRLVFIRFLEDKGIEEPAIINFRTHKSAWNAFLALCKRLEPKYNGLVFKPHKLLDGKEFSPPDDNLFVDICDELADPSSPYDFNQIPISILGSIYERFLGKVVHATAKRVSIEEKPEVRKAGGVYYTPQYVVRYIVNETVGKLIEGKTPKEIVVMAFGDIACGSGSFLIEVYQRLLEYHTQWYIDHPDKRGKDDTFTRDGKIHLTLKKKREILANNIYGVDLDFQATEVTQLSLYLKLLEETTLQETHQLGLFKGQILPDLRQNIVCGNSLIGRDILDGELFDTTIDHDLKPMDFNDVFPAIMQKGGFDAVVGNPPYSLIGSDRPLEKKYFTGGSFEMTAYKLNTYMLMLERGLKLLKASHCRLGFIIPKSLVFNTYFAEARRFLLLRYSIPLIVEIRDKVFAEAEVGDSILFFAETTSNPHHNILYYKTVENIFPAERVIEESQISQKELLDDSEVRFAKGGLRLRVSTLRLDELASVSNGLNPGNVRHILLSNKRETHRHREMVLGRDIQRYSIKWSGTWVNYDPSLRKRIKLSDIRSKSGMTAQKKIDFALRTPEIYERNKILIRKTADKLVASFDAKGFYFDSLAYGIQKKEDTREDTLFILGVLNGRLLNFLHNGLSLNKEKVFAKVLAENVRKLPIRTINFDNAQDKFRHDHIVKLVEQMLDAKEKLTNAKTEAETNRLEMQCQTIDRRIDEAVYELYGLTEDEIRVLEG